MVLNIGSILGLVGAGLVVGVMNHKINKKTKKEVKVYGEETISVARERRRDNRSSGGKSNGTSSEGEGLSSGTNSFTNIRESEVEDQGSNEGRWRIQDQSSADYESLERESGEDDETDIPSSITIPDVEQI